MKKIILLLFVAGLLFVFVSACGETGLTGGITPGAGSPDDMGEIEDLPQGEEIEGDGSDIICDADIVLPGEGEESNADLMIAEYFSVTGIIESIEVINGLTSKITIEDSDGNPAILTVTGSTIFPFADSFEVGDTVTGWYPTDMPLILPWPPQYTVSVLAVNTPDGVNIRVDRFTLWEDNSNGLLISQDRMFAFDTDDNTEIVLADGDTLTADEIEGFRLIVIYGVSTRSIPEMATADKVIRLFETIVPL